MAKLLTIHSKNPQQRLLQRVVDILEKGGVIVYPTDSVYALGCRLGDKSALERMQKIRGIEHHYFTLVCRNLSEISHYAIVDNKSFRLLKSHTPGSYTFILPSTKAVPRYFQCKTRNSIGLRIPDNQIVQELLRYYDQPIVSTSLILPDGIESMYDPHTIADTLEGQVDLVIDGGYCGIEATTIIDLCGERPVIVRRGKGDITFI